MLADVRPVVRGHTLCVPRPHASSLADLSQPQRELAEAAIKAGLNQLGDVYGTGAFAVEHGRSPICFAERALCHTHVHLAPVALDLDALEAAGFLRPALEIGKNEYVAIYDHDDRFYFTLERPVRHLARTLFAILLNNAGRHWLPLSADAAAIAEVVEATVQDLRVAQVAAA